MRRIVSVVAGALLTLGMIAGPAAAHPNTAADRVVGPGGTAINNSGGQAVVAHQGIECAEDDSPNIGDATFECVNPNAD